MDCTRNLLKLSVSTTAGRKKVTRKKPIVAKKKSKGGGGRIKPTERVAEQTGTNGPDILNGTSGNDIIFGLGGNERHDSLVVFGPENQTG